MNKMIFAGVAAASLMFAASAAFAGTQVNANVDLSGIRQVTTDDVTQVAKSAVDIDGKLTGSNATSGAVNALQVASVTKDLNTVTDYANNGGAGNLDLTGVSQRATDSVEQIAKSYAETGMLSASNVTSTATNVAQDANITVRLNVNH